MPCIALHGLGALRHGAVDPGADLTPAASASRMKPGGISMASELAAAHAPVQLA
jgi:hypothetical protein